MNAIAILNLVPLMQSTTILTENIKLARKPNKKAGDFVRTGVSNILATEFTRITANQIGLIK